MERPDTDHTDEIVCPYCGYEFSESYEYHGDDGQEVQCHHCDKHFELSVDHRVTFSTRRIDCDDDAHEWGDAEAINRSQSDCDSYNERALCRRTDWKPATLWKRCCINCDDAEYMDTELGGDNPWEADEEGAGT